MDHSITEDDLPSQKSYARPVKELDTFVRRIVASVVQVPRMLQSPGRKIALAVPHDQVCVRADLDGALLGIHAVKLCRVLGGQFNETLDVQALASKDAFRIQ